MYRITSFAIALTLLATLSWQLPVVSAATKSQQDSEKARYAKICGNSYPSLNARGYKTLQFLGKASGKASLEFSASPQHIAMCWIIHKDKAKAESFQMMQRYALATLFFGTQPDKWITKTNWLSGESVCKWYGVKCDMWSRVTGLDLGFNQLNGILVREIGQLTYLEDLRLTANDFQGVIPPSIEKLKNLQVLQLNMNGFFGYFPKELGKMRNLRELHLYGNYLQGSVPPEIGQLSNLELLDLNANFFSGQLPSAIGKMSKLKELYFNDNTLTGSMPAEICKLKKVEALVADCRGTYPEVRCTCCTVCCKDNEDPKCVKVKSSQSKKK